MGIITLLIMPFLDILSVVISVYFKVVAVDIILYWLLRYNIITVHNKYAEKFMQILKALTEPAYNFIRKKVKPIGEHDIAPYVLLLIIWFIGSFVAYLNEWIRPS
ncbi:MAG: YggT family protein [Alphaproteobacteria bacterium]|nr:YggT family protein [Alphaproteobacteria bacterium]